MGQQESRPKESRDWTLGVFPPISSAADAPPGHRVENEKQRRTGKGGKENDAVHLTRAT
jgi:hypothetical protein